MSKGFKKIQEIFLEETLKGGKADKLTLPKIAKKHKVSLEDLTKEFQKGLKVEKEHTDDKKKIKEIVLDHLSENPKYYTKLKKVKLEETVLENLKINQPDNLMLAKLNELDELLLNEEALPSKLDTDINIEYHKKLNTQFWLNNHLKSNIRKKLLSLAKFYIKQLDLGVEVKDIIFTGSLSNYNYTKLSDVDIHIVINYKDLSDDEDFVKEYFADKRTIWAQSNDIKINGFPVEIYVQDESQLKGEGMSSMYSLLNNKWLRKPKYKLPEVDKHLITTKVNKYLDILNKISNMKDSTMKIDAYNKVFEKIRDNRREATKNEGEFSIDNLVFKVLRNKKVFDIVRDDKKEIVNNVFSIKTN